MEFDHTFHPKHGFTGSAHTTKEFRPEVPGFQRGTNIGGSNAEEAGEVPNLKHGGMAHLKSHHKNYAHGGKVEHDEHPKNKSHSHYDEHGFEVHKGHKKHKKD